VANVSVSAGGLSMRMKSNKEMSSAPNPSIRLLLLLLKSLLFQGLLLLLLDGI